MGENSVSVKTFRYFFSLFFRWPGRRRLAQNVLDRGGLIAHYTKHEPCQGEGVGVNPPRFFEKKVLVFSAVTGGGGYSQSLIPFYSILYIT